MEGVCGTRSQFLDFQHTLCVVGGRDISPSLFPISLPLPSVLLPICRPFSPCLLVISFDIRTTPAMALRGDHASCRQCLHHTTRSHGQAQAERQAHLHRIVDDVVMSFRLSPVQVVVGSDLLQSVSSRGWQKWWLPGRRRQRSRRLADLRLLYLK
jgi:hypothetical protein